ncbi:cell division protein ZipA [Shewanella sp. ULN5]|uniref:cell division protein ZipA n=1 Tax=Shewanella sp. ULN5 TaxID=2994678 RepID=UPI00273DAD19|nr:cell division protein ZipA [Shewanella sp. ULN5]MDP5146670.1 cell division protein ZipA [Shewanella sp. ULN5]
MEDLQLVLLVLGAIAIIAVLVHGFWSIRKQQPKSMKQSPMANFYKEQAERRDSEGFDNDGIGPVRVLKSTDVEPVVTKPILKTAGLFKPQHAKTAEPLVAAEAISKAKSEPVMPSIDDELEQEPQITLTTSQDIKSVQMEPIDKPKHYSNPDVVQDEPEAEEVVEEPQVLADPTDVLVLHVVAKTGQQLQGAELLSALLSLNFKFGDMEIFHRHIDNAGTGKVLFSLANMVKPGTFDPDNMEQFVTDGVVLFMTLPCYGDPKMNFTIMLNSALQLVDDLGAELLDGKRQPWDDTAKEDYKRRIAAA